MRLRLREFLHAARATGTVLAQGEFIAYVDGDDWVAPAMYDVMIRAARDEQAEIVLCGADIATAPDHVTGYKVRFRAREVVENGILDRFCRLELGSGVIWNKLYRAEMIREVMARPLERRVDSGADYIVNFGCFAAAKRIVLLPDPLYFYFYREDSMSRAPKRGANFALALRAYVVCLEIHSRENPAAVSGIDELYARQFRYDAYRIEDPRELDPVRADLAESLRRLSEIHAAGIYSLVRALDTANDGPPAVKHSFRRLLHAIGDVRRAISSRLFR